MLSINIIVKRYRDQDSHYDFCLLIMPLEKYSHYELDMKGDLFPAHFQFLRSYLSLLWRCDPRVIYGRKNQLREITRKNDVCTYITKKMFSPCQ